MHNDPSHGLSQSFSKDATKPSLSGMSLNYVWINREKFKPAAEGALCGVPLHVLDKAIQNAAAYPDVKVNLWLDGDLLDEASIAMVASHLYIQGAHTIRLRNIRDIKDIRAHRALMDPERAIPRAPNALFHDEQAGRHGNIWGRVDLARLLAVRQALREGDTYAFYADFDIEDVSLNNPRLHRILDRHDMVFGTTSFDTPIFENSYFGFGRFAMAGYTLDRMIAGTACMVDKGHNGYDPYYQGILNYTYGKNLALQEAPLAVGMPVVTNRMGYRIPRNDLYTDLGINEP